MRTEKKFISEEYVGRLNKSPYFIVVDYRGMTVPAFSELRKRLRPTGSELHVVKNSIFRVAAKEAGVADLTGTMAGQMAVVTGSKDVSATAKVLKTFSTEFDKGKVQFGYLNSQRLENKQLMELADLPSIEVLRAMILGTILAPASQIARVLAAPGAQLARVIQANVDKQGEGEAK